MSDTTATPQRGTATEHYDYVVIGMGIGGLTLGALLAHAGRKVIIIRTN